MDRYPISTLDIEGVVVWFTLWDHEVLGFVKFTASGRPVYRTGPLSRSEDLPKHARPSLWRPVHPETWPDALPEAAVVQSDVAWGADSPLPSKTAPEPNVRDLDRWPYPHVTLGRAGDIPKSQDEAEARVLRALRAADALYRDHAGHACEAAWPHDLLVSAAVLAKMLRASKTGKLPWLTADDYRDVHVDLSDLSAKPARWCPTRRDVSDLEWGCLDWMRPLPRKFQQLFRWRSALPQYSFRQIGEMQDRSEDDVRSDYREACARVFQEARSVIAL